MVNFKYCGNVTFYEVITMPGRIKTAQQAAKEHKGVTKRGNKVSLKNSDGRRVTVGKNYLGYHRGKGKFGRYSTKADAKRVSRGATSLTKPVGSGPYRHTSDYKKGAKKRGKR